MACSADLPLEPQSNAAARRLRCEEHFDDQAQERAPAGEHAEGDSRPDAGGIGQNEAGCGRSPTRLRGALAIPAGQVGIRSTTMVRTRGVSATETRDPALE